MKKHTKSYRTSQYVHLLQHPLRYALLMAGLWCIGIFASISILVPQQVNAQSDDSIPGGNVSNPTIRAVDIAKPAVVRIRTDVRGHLTVHFPPTTDVSFPQQANGNYPLAFTGTGTFISSQGDVLTADDVVEPPQDQVLNPALYSAAAQDIANYMNKNAQAGSTQVSANDVVQQLTNGKLSSTPAYESPTSHVYLSTDYAGTYTASDLNSVPSNLTATVDKIKAHSPFEQEDMAIVHVNMTDTPSVALGNSDNVQQQDQLTIIGFPANADISPKPQAFLTSSTSLVSVSSKKTSDGGTPLLQVGSHIDQGNNGGTALNGQGEIVGVVSLGPSNGSNNSAGDTSFLQASSSVLKLAQGVNLDMTVGSFQEQWSQAFADYAATASSHWHKAEREFTQLAHSYPDFQAVQPFLTYAQTQAQTEPTNLASVTPTQVHNTGSGANSPTSGGHSSGLAAWQAWVILVAAAVLFLVVVGSLFTVLVRKKERKIIPTQNAAGGKEPATVTVPKSSGAPTITSQSPATNTKGTGQNTLSLKVWPCGHMNQPNAIFCNVCGEPAPVPPKSVP